MTHWNAIFSRLIFLGTLLLIGCSSSTPDLIRQVPVNQVKVYDAQQNIQSYIGQKVRWGGTIIQVENFTRQTAIEILSRPLSEDGKPDEDSPGEGRFLAIIDGFAEPAEYPRGRLITVYGELTGKRIKAVGEYPYHYPEVRLETLHIWPAPQPRHDYYPYRDPFFYDPWWPYWRPWPYYPPYYW